MNTTSNNGRVPFISKIAYGMGDVGCNFSWMFVSNFLMIFYTDMFGIGMSAVATLMLVSRIWDAVNDPLEPLPTRPTHAGDVSVLGFCSELLLQLLYLCSHSGHIPTGAKLQKLCIWLLPTASWCLATLASTCLTAHYAEL